MSLGRLSREELLRRGIAALALPLLPTIVTGCRSNSRRRLARPLTGSYQAWILRLYPQLAAMGSPHPLFQSLTQRILELEAERRSSAVDFYVGITPFLDLVPLRDASVLTSWEDVMPTRVVSDMPDPVRREVSLDGKIYSWPFLLDVTILGWNAELVERAGLDPGRGPQTWDELVEAARKVIRSGAAPYGCTFDPRPWRSLVPITHSFSTKVYDKRGRFDYRSESVANALEVLRRLRELANPDVLDATFSSARLTPDEQAFSAGLAAYYVKYQNAHIRMASTWPDPGRLVLTRLPRPPVGAGKTCFWTTGIGLLHFGSNPSKAARYANSITYDEGFWRSAIGGGRAAGGQIPVFKSLWRKWLSDPSPPWPPRWAEGIDAQLAHAAPIPPSAAGIGQFRPSVQAELNSYLDGYEPSARRALRRAAEVAATNAA